MPTLTVFTPAYNRAHTLPRTYESLRKQECKDFLWLIVDDGSEDNTAQLVSQWQSKKDNGFEIRYVYKKNGGMHTAHNTAFEQIDTELNICIDSDDYMADGAVAKILAKWKEVKSCGYAGLLGLDADPAGKIIGKGFPQGLTETTLGDYYRHGGSGDKKMVYRTDVVNQYPPYPEFEGEKYVALGYKFNLIDRDYKLSVINEVLCNVDYQPDGHSTVMWKEYLRSPKGWAFYRKFCMEHPHSKKRLLIDCIHYCSSSIIAKNKSFIKESPKKLLTVFCAIPGYILSLITKRRGRR